MPLNVVVHQQALIDMGRPPAGPVYRKWLMIMAKIDAKAKMKLTNDMVNVRTGNLRSSQQPPVVVLVGNRIIGSCVNRASYAAFVHEGTAPHDIPMGGVPGDKILTGWSYGGAPVFTPVVHHPGTAARPWLRDALVEVIHSTR